jgi:hypothetical protein
MKIFELGQNYQAVCVFEGTRSGFRHVATLLRNGSEIAKTKICYQNRTWESYEFESVLLKLIDENFDDTDDAGIRGIKKQDILKNL